MTNRIKGEVLSFISQKSKIPKSELSLETEIYDSSIISSLSMLELITHLEDQFSIYVEAEELTEDNFFNIQTIVSFVEKKSQSQV